jgi:hypothetical protein
MPDPQTEELRLEQVRRAKAEEDQARGADQEAAEKAHGRRADKAEYLREKLSDRAKAEDEATRGD